MLTTNSMQDLAGFRTEVLCRCLGLGLLSGKSILPVMGAERFTCPLCGTLAQQEWLELRLHSNYYTSPKASGFRASQCGSCGERLIWEEFSKEIVYPTSSLFPHPEPDLDDVPSGIKYYEEARQVAPDSPRAAAALLRFLVERIIEHLNQAPVTNLAKAIEQLRLSNDIAESMELVRLVGNKAVHGGEIQLHEDPEVLVLLFEIVNQLVAQMISHPKRTKAARAKLKPTSNA